MTGDPLKFIKPKVPIPHEDWNAAFDFLRRNRPLTVLASESGGWSHPWRPKAEWSYEREQWEFWLKPGFVNGEDVEVDVDGGIILLTDDVVRIPVPALRSIGADASPTGQVDDGAGGIRYTFEEVPEYFQALGVGSHDPSGFTASGREFGSVRGAADIAGADDRLLRAFEIVLAKERLTTEVSWTLGANVVIQAQFDVVYGNLSFRRAAYIRAARTYSPYVDESDPVARISGEWSDNPIDEVHVATGYLLSPPGAPEDSDPDDTWTPYFASHLFWNLNYATSLLPAIASPPPIIFPLINSLAGGVGATAVNSLLSQRNDALDAVFEFLRNKTIEGRFWTT